MIIWCCGCSGNSFATLKRGDEIYPHRKDLKAAFFWKCNSCGNYVGTHKHSKKHTPLGVISTQEIRAHRRKIHKAFDPLWKSGKISRNAAYKLISKKCGYEYHTAEIRTVEEAERIYAIVLFLVDKFKGGGVDGRAYEFLCDGMN